MSADAVAPMPAGGSVGAQTPTHRSQRRREDRAASPDWRAYATIVEAHRAALYRTALLLTGDRAAAEDLVSDTLIALHEPWAGGRIDEFAAYARRALTNRYLSDVRRRDRFAKLSPRIATEPMSDDSASGAVDRLPVVAALDSLSPRQRAVVVARYYDDLSVHDTAEALGMSEGTVKSTTFDALARLKIELREARK